MTTCTRTDAHAIGDCPRYTAMNVTTDYAAALGIEEDMMPRNFCGNCWVRSTRDNPVRWDSRSGRRLCRECEPNPEPLGPGETEG